MRGLGVVVRADDMHVALLYRHGLEQIERLALGNALRDIDQHDVRELLGGNPMRRGRAYVACSYDGYFLAHVSPVFSATACFRSFAMRTRWSSPWWRPASGARSHRLRIFAGWSSPGTIRPASRPRSSREIRAA